MTLLLSSLLEAVASRFQSYCLSLLRYLDDFQRIITFVTIDKVIRNGPYIRVGYVRGHGYPVIREKLHWD